MGMKPTTLWAEASRVASDPLVSARLAQLQAEAAKECSYDTAQLQVSIIHRLNTLADNAGSESARVRALELLGKASGLFDEASAKDAGSRTVVELRVRLEQRLRLMLEVAPRSPGNGNIEAVHHAGTDQIGRLAER
jgi:hypothetical protein